MKKLFLILGLILAAFLAYYCVFADSKKIDGDITSRLSAKMAGANLPGVRTDVDGRDVTLTGIVEDTSLKQDAGKVAESLYGVRVVDNQIQVEAPQVAVVDELPPMEAFSEPNPFIEMESPILEMPAMPEAVVESDIIVAEPMVVLEPVVEQPVVQMDEPLTVRNHNIVRRKVDTITAQKTVIALCQTNLTSLMQNQKINFDSGRATIQSRSHDLLDRISKAAKSCDKDTIITVNGYTDNIGNIESNRQLSVRRARAVGKYMLKRGVAKQVKIVGHGANDPVAGNDTAEGRAQNRRIEFKVFTRN